MKNFKNKVAAITGAGSGIGQQLAVLLAKQGCHLSLSDVNAQGLAQTVELLEKSNVRVTTQKLDVADRDAMKAWAADTVHNHGSVNMIFNNAGVALGSTVEGASYEELEWIVNINFWGVVYGTKEFLPLIKKSGEGRSPRAGRSARPGAARRGSAAAHRSWPRAARAARRATRGTRSRSLPHARVGDGLPRAEPTASQSTPATRSATAITERFVFARGIVGMTDASATTALRCRARGRAGRPPRRSRTCRRGGRSRELRAHVALRLTSAPGRRSRAA